WLSARLQARTRLRCSAAVMPNVMSRGEGAMGSAAPPNRNEALAKSTVLRRRRCPQFRVDGQAQPVEYSFPECRFSHAVVSRCRMTLMPEITRRGFTVSLIGAAAARGQASEDLAALSLTAAASRIRAGTVTSTQLTQACLARIEVYNPKLNSFITVTRPQALAQARELDAEQRSGK